MRIECDKCAAKYSIADEKVRGKTFKIRCKKCSNVIIVRDKAAAAAAGGGEAAASEPAAPEEQPPGWHLAIDGETVGPLNEDEVRRRYDAGEIDKSTSVWQEGFEDWLELGQIEAFANLPERDAGAGAAAAAGLAAAGAAAAAAGAAEDDPFASSASDSGFAGGSGEFGGGGDFGGSGGFGSEPDPEPAAPAAAAAAPAADESPRIDSLTGQRNENSVLFSLDSLKAMASSQKPASAGPVRSAPSTTAPASEGSGLIDIRAMGAMMDMPASDAGGGGGLAGGGGEDEMLPSFGGSGLGGLSVEPLVTETAPSAAPVEPQPQRSNAPMYILIALLAAGLIGLGAVILLKEPEDPQVIKEVITVPGKVEEKDDKEEDKKEDEKEDEKEEESAEETGGTETGGDEAGTKSGGSSKKKKKSGGSAGVAGTSGGSTSGSSSSGGDSTPKPKDPDVDCLLDPNLAKCKGGGGGGGGGGSSAPDPSLPKKLGQTQILSGISSAKTAAKSCGSGTTVAIKFSVKGATGSVVSATPLDEHASSSVGKCVANAAKKAKFPKFQAEQQGFTFKFRL